MENTTTAASITVAKDWANAHRARREILQLASDIGMDYHLVRDFARGHTKRPAYDLVHALLRHKERSESGAQQAAV